MKRIYLLPRLGKHVPGEIMQCSIFLEAHNVAMLWSLPETDRGMFWVNESDEQRALDLLSEAGFKAISSD
jgi:hypothetical protein